MTWACFQEFKIMYNVFFNVHFLYFAKIVYLSHLLNKALVFYIQELKFNNSKPSMY
jgi:hypothetical protein